MIGQSLRIPDNGKSAVKSEDKTNTPSKDKKEETTLSPKIKESGIIHTVKSGERLDKIAKKYGVAENDILVLNALKNKNLRIGDKLKIPTKTKVAEKVDPKVEKTKDKKDKETAKTQNTKKDEKTSKPNVIPKYHVVEKGQTLYAIARLYNISPDKILKLNPKLKNGKVIVGQKIQLKE